MSGFGDTAIAQSVVGRLAPGETVRIDLDAPVTADWLIVEIDGRVLPGLAVARGDFVEVTIPDDLFGIRHDLRILALRADGTEELGRWIFETESARRLVFGSVQTETGFRSTADKKRAFATGTVRLEFDRGDGQLRGRIVLSRNGQAGETGADEVEVGDIFLEARRPFMGRDLFLRLGNSEVVSQTTLMDDASRRGLTVRLADPDGQLDLSAFQLGTETELDLDNVLGLADADARITGVVGIVRPAGVPGARLDFAAFEGRAGHLPDDSTGAVEGRGLSAMLPFAESRGDVMLAYSETRWAGTPGQAVEAGANWQLAEPGGVQSLALGLSASRIDMDYFSPLNPGLIRGETGAAVSLEFVDPAWQWRLEASSARTNTKGAATDPTDRLRGISANLIYDPGDFTGGFLNGTLFFLNAGIDWVDRIDTPTGAAAPEDQTQRRLSFGMEKVQPRYNWAWSVALDDIEDRAARGADQSSAFVSGRIGLEPTPEISALFFVNAGQRWTETTRYNEAEVAVSFNRLFDGGIWEAGIATGFLVNEDPARDDGLIAAVSIARRLSDRVKLVGEVEWGRDSYTPDDVSDEGWSVGVFLRTDFSFSRGT